MTDAILIDERRDQRLLIATLNRPNATNGIDRAMGDALTALAERVEQSPHIDALILTGAGRAFCSGGDLAMFKDALADDESPETLASLLDGLATTVHSALRRLTEAGPLLVAAVNGPATGAGLGLVCACDVAYARPTATLRAGFSKLGLSPDSGTTYFVPRRIGLRQAIPFMLGGDAVRAEQGLTLGFFNALIDGDDDVFLSEVITRTQALIACGAAARATRALLRGSAEASLADQLTLEQRSLVALAGNDAVLTGLRRKLSGT
ncbi:enoyl-CoA hydratase/isomerase family protein [Polycyclovorans algicola]|uniref:enoyl-CoA hydratase/isomerase family protein n=1 Tax=Polycyclovorans algicola TaxID=616992 RepID=UPI000A7D9220|nr:enoyl-CoA hydratase/isomerase family protein [Polycyclovorans algicola]